MATFIHIFNIIIFLSLVYAVFSSEPITPPTGKESWNTNVPSPEIITSHDTFSTNDPIIIDGAPAPRPRPTPKPAPISRPSRPPLVH
ncbi:unnamed protein product [Lupinus luteus]|uniref:Transmembrane protein n=1 Tax=Lupinus luteus TaxID=3873 RepID=A0AAV1XSQ9_LUPLU